MSKASFTGILPVRYEGAEAVVCEAHRAQAWQPMLRGAPIKVSGHVLRYVKRADAAAALACAAARRESPDTYKLGHRMAKRSRPVLTVSCKGNKS